MIAIVTPRAAVRSRSHLLSSARLIHHGFVVFSPTERAAVSMTRATAAGWEI
jgi:hypothetical protein